MSARALEILVIGGGEHARVVMDACRSRPQEFSVVGFLDPSPCFETEQRTGIHRLVGEEQQIVAIHVAKGGQLALGVGAIGVSGRRNDLVERMRQPREAWASVVHARAILSDSVQVAEGAVVMPGAILGTGVIIGAFAVVNTGAVVDHDVHVGDFAQIGPGVAIGGGARVGRGAYVALGSRVRDHVTIGSNALVALGAAVLGDVADGARVQGVPARLYPS